MAKLDISLFLISLPHYSVSTPTFHNVLVNKASNELETYHRIPSDPSQLLM